MNITVYLGSSEGKDSSYRTAITELGHWIGENGHRLVYGGSANGLMGVLANSVLEKGGEVIGVEPRFFLELGYEHPGITQLIETENMSERKNKMIELGDAFVAFPGGTGTLEEIAEIISLNALERIRKPYVFFNLNGFYDSLGAFFDKMTEEGFVTPEKRAKIRFAASVEEIANALH